MWTRGRPAVMGIVNVTPDSFADGGRFFAPEEAIAHALTLLDEGADILDIGGESTRPGADGVPSGTEIDRVIPVIVGILAVWPEALVSIDTSKAAVAEAALAAGAVIVNDVTAGRDEAMLPLVARAGATVVLMHMRGEPRTMQAETAYDDVVAEVHHFLRERAADAGRAGVAEDAIVLDPGIGFGKDLDGNLRLLAALPDLAALGFPVLLGASRKSFISKLTGADVATRLPGSLAAAQCALACPRAIVRVHDVAATVQFLAVAAAIAGAA